MPGELTSSKNRMRRGGTGAAGTSPKPAQKSTRITRAQKVTDLDSAINELTDRGVLEEGKMMPMSELLELLANFTVKEGEGVPEAENLVRALGWLLKEEMVSMTAYATADAVMSRVASMLGEERAQAKKTQEEEMAAVVRIRKDLAGREKALEEQRKGMENDSERVLNKFTQDLEDKLGAAVQAINKVDERLSGVMAGNVVRAGEMEGGPWARGEPTMAEMLASGRGVSGLSEEEQGRGARAVRRGEDRRDRQLMLDAQETDGRKSLEGMTEASLTEKAKRALASMTAESLIAGKPEKAEVLGATLQRQGGVLFTLNTKETREWLARPDVLEAFTEGLGHRVEYRPRKFPVLAQLVPVDVALARKETLRDIEEANGLAAGSLIDARWIRNPTDRSATQRHAHAIINCSCKETANQLIENEATIAGRMVESIKLLKEPTRCYNCQGDGHFASQCTARPVCGSCGGEHRTNTCKERRNYYCAVCGTSGHPAWTRDCPNFLSRQRNLSDRVPENLYRFYVTSDPKTWELLTNETHRQTYRPPRPRNRAGPAPSGANAMPLGRPRRSPTPPPAPAIHPRPENVARPFPGGDVRAPSRQGTLSTWLNVTGEQEDGEISGPASTPNA